MHRYSMEKIKTNSSRFWGYRFFIFFFFVMVFVKKLYKFLKNPYEFLKENHMNLKKKPYEFFKKNHMDFLIVMVFLLLAKKKLDEKP